VSVSFTHQQRRHDRHPLTQQQRRAKPERQRPQTSTTAPLSPEKEEQSRRYPQASMKP